MADNANIGSTAYEAGAGRIRLQRAEENTRAIQGAVDIMGFGLDIYKEVRRAEEARWASDSASITKTMDGIIYGDPDTGSEGIYANIIGLDDAVKASDAESFEGFYSDALSGVMDVGYIMEHNPGVSEQAARRWLEENGERYSSEMRRRSANDFIRTQRAWMSSSYTAESNVSANDASMDAASLSSTLSERYSGGVRNGFAYDPSGAADPALAKNWSTYSVQHATVRAKDAIEKGILTGDITSSSDAAEYARNLYETEYAPLYDTSDPTSAYYAQVSAEQAEKTAKEYFATAWNTLATESANKEAIASGVLSNMYVSLGRNPTLSEISKAFADTGGNPDENFFDASSQWSLIQRFAGKGAANASASLRAATERYRGTPRDTGTSALEGFVSAADEEGYSETSLQYATEEDIITAGNAVSMEESRREGFGIDAALDELMSTGYDAIPADMKTLSPEGVTYKAGGVTGQIEITDGVSPAVQQAAERYNAIRASDPNATVSRYYSSAFMPYYRSLMEKHGITSPEGQITFLDAVTGYEKTVEPTIGTDYLALPEIWLASGNTYTTDEMLRMWDAIKDASPDMTVATYDEGRKRINALSGGTSGDMRLDTVVKTAGNIINGYLSFPTTGDKDAFKEMFFSQYSDTDALISLYSADASGNLDQQRIRDAVNSAYRIYTADNSWGKAQRSFQNSMAKEYNNRFNGFVDEVRGLNSRISEDAYQVYQEYFTGNAVWADDDIIEEIALATATDVTVDPDAIRERISQRKYSVAYKDLTQGRKNILDANITVGLMQSAQSSMLENALKLDPDTTRFWPVHIKERGIGIMLENGAVVTAGMDGTFPVTFVALGGIDPDTISRAMRGEDVTISEAGLRISPFYQTSDDIYTDPGYMNAISYVLTGEGMPPVASPYGNYRSLTDNPLVRQSYAFETGGLRLK